MSVTGVPADTAPAQEGHRPSIYLVGAAVVVGGAPGIVPLFFVPQSRLLLFSVLGFLWLLMHYLCGLCAYRARSADVRIWVPIYVAAFSTLTAIMLGVVGLIAVPGSLLWLTVATQSWGDMSAGEPGIVDDLVDYLRKLYG
jgi:hypothetical protein